MEEETQEERLKRVRAKWGNPPDYDPNYTPPLELSDVPDYDQWRHDDWHARRVKFTPTAKDQDIIDKYFELNPVNKTQRQVVEVVARECKTSYERVEEVLKKGLLRERGKEQKIEITERVYGDKLTVIKDIMEQGLQNLHAWVTSSPIDPADCEKAKVQLAIVTGLNTLLRLEMGKSTQNVEVVQTVNKEVSVILEDLRQKDPFRTYPTLPAPTNDNEKSDAPG